MINASKAFKEKLKTGGTVVNYADVTLSDGTVLHLEPKDIMVGGCTIDDKTTNGKFGVGFVTGKTLSLRIANHDEQFSLYDFYNSIITLCVAMRLDDGSIEKIRKGVYYTTIPETPGEIIEISAVDGMYRLDRDYAESSTVYPATLQTIITEACTDCGIPIGFTQFDNMSFVAPEKPEKATYRDAISWACQIAGYNARIDNNGYMQLVWYDTNLMDSQKIIDGGNLLYYSNGKTINGGDFTDYSSDTVISGVLFTDRQPEHVFRFKNLTVSTDDVQITGVRVVNDETEGVSGEKGYVITLDGNPFASGKEQEIAGYLGLRMIGLTFRPFSGDVLQNPLYEPFDVCRISDRKGNVYHSVINSVSYTVGGYTQIACEAEDPVRNGSVYSSPEAGAVVEARRNAQKQLSEYDKAVQNMNQIAMNAMGFHTTYEDRPDGSRITYLHDKPNLSDSKIIYKQTIDGFFVSQDGGKSYTAGFDSQGNAVVNILYAIGIVADWIRTGRLVVKKGDQITLLADTDTGEVRIIADYFALSSGKTIDEIAQEKAEEAVDEQTQTDILNKLTNNGADNGIYLLNGKLYISFSSARGGDLTLGGVNNVNGKIKMLGSDSSEIGGWGKDDFHIGDYFYVNNRGMVSKDKNFSKTYSGFLNLEHSAVFDDETQNVYVTLNNVDVGDNKDITIVVTAQYHRNLADGTEVFYQSTTVGYGITINESQILVTRVDPGNPQYADTITGFFDKENRTAVIMFPGRLINSYTPYRDGDHIYDADGNEIFKDTGNSLDSVSSSAFSMYEAAEIKNVQIRKGNVLIAENQGTVIAISGMSIDTIEKKITGGGFELTPNELKCVGDFLLHLVRSLDNQTDVFRVTENDLYHGGIRTSSSGETLVWSSGNILRKTSSAKRYKNTIRPISETPECDPEKLYDIDVVTFRYNDGYIPDTDQRYRKDIPGFIADDVLEKYPIACDLDADGRPEMWNIHIMFPAALRLIQKQHEEIECLKERVGMLEEKMEEIYGNR